MTDTVIDGQGRTILHETAAHHGAGLDAAHLSRQGLLAADASRDLQLLRETAQSGRDALLAVFSVKEAVAANSREVLTSMAAIQGAIKDEGDKTRTLMAQIDRDRTNRELSDAKAEILWLRRPGTT